MPYVCHHAFNLRVYVTVLVALLIVGRLRGSACGESDSDVDCGDPLSLLFVRFLGDNCYDVALCVTVH